MTWDDLLDRFENDGCTLWPDFWRGIDLRECCAVHDEAFAVGQSVAEFVAANAGLFTCAVGRGAWEWAVLALIGVMTIGAPFFWLGRKRVQDDKHWPA